jgi:hypothetical protein
MMLSSPRPDSSDSSQVPLLPPNLRFQRNYGHIKMQESGSFSQAKERRKSFGVGGAGNIRMLLN